MDAASKRSRALAVREPERGAALLALVTVLAMGAAATLMHAAGVGAFAQRDARVETRQALFAAKEALIAYAVTNPTRPGALPCPDADGDGRYRPATPDTRGARCASDLGWFPQATLDMTNVRDGSGARLWYAVGEPNWPNRARAAPLNSGTPGGLSVDGTPDWVAAVIAPGPPMRGQRRRGAARARSAEDEAGQFLEGRNAQVSAFGDYASAGNDIVLGISRVELMARVEQRVLADALAAVERFSRGEGNATGAPPWLSPFDDPLHQAAFPARPGVRDGWLPAPDDQGVVVTGFELGWRFGRAGARLSPPAALGGVPIRDGELLRGAGVVVPAASGRCLAQPPDQMDCVGESAWVSDGLTAAGRPVERSYRFSIRLSDDVPRVVDVRWPGASSVRTRAVRAVFDRGHRALEGRTTRSPLPRIAYAVELRKRSSATGETASRRLYLAGGVQGWLHVEGIEHPLSAASGELPAWFQPNAWHRYVRVIVAPDRVPGGSGFGGACAPRAADRARPCLAIVSSTGATIRANVRAAAIAMGPALATQQRQRQPPLLEDLFEQTNAAGGLTAVQLSGPPAEFNDRVRAAHVRTATGRSAPVRVSTR